MARKQNKSVDKKKAVRKSQISETIKFPVTDDTLDDSIPEGMIREFHGDLNDAYDSKGLVKKKGSTNNDDLLEMKKHAQYFLESVLNTIPVEDPKVLQRDNQDYSKINLIKYKGQHFCSERLQKLFTDNDYPIEVINDRSFIVHHEDGGIILVRVSKSLPLVRFEIPLVFKARVSRIRRLNFMNEMMMRYPLIRVYIEDQYENVTADYNYCDGLYVNQVLTLFNAMKEITYTIYTEENEDNILDPGAVGIY